jgi:L-asparaginase
MSIDKAFQKTFDELAELDGFAGAIAIDYHGNIYNQESHPKVVFASYDGNQIKLFD